MKLIVVRHGETNYNKKNLINSKPTEKVYLTPKGVSQAQEVADKLKEESIDIIIVSELYRSEQTAAIINNYHLRPMFIDERINDHKIGLEGEPITKYYDLIKDFPDWKTAKLQGGESYLEMKQRVFEFLKDLERKKQFKTVLVVTHLAIVRLIKSYFEKLSDEEIINHDVKNCEMVVFQT